MATTLDRFAGFLSSPSTLTMFRSATSSIGAVCCSAPYHAVYALLKLTNLTIRFC
jgi:hypothetical protein